MKYKKNYIFIVAFIIFIYNINFSFSEENLTFIGNVIQLEEESDSKQKNFINEHPSDEIINNNEEKTNIITPVEKNFEESNTKTNVSVIDFSTTNDEIKNETQLVVEDAQVKNEDISNLESKKNEIKIDLENKENNSAQKDNKINIKSEEKEKEKVEEKEEFKQNKEPLKLYDLINIALERNHQTRQAWLSIIMSELDVGVKKSAFYPKAYLKNEFDVSHNKKMNLIAQTNSIEASYSLLFGKDILNVDKSKILLEQKVLEKNVVIKTLISNVVELYFSILSLKEQEKAATHHVELAKNVLDAAKTKYRIGMVPLNDKIQAQASYSSSQLELIEIQNSLKKTNGRLNVLLDLEPQYVLYIEDYKLQIKDNELEHDFIYYLEEAKLNREELQILYKEKKKSLLSLEMLKLSRLPSIQLSYGLSYNPLHYATIHEQLLTNTFRVSVVTPLFTGFEISNTINLELESIKIASSKIEEKEKEIELELWIVYQDYITNLMGYKNSFDALKSSEESANLTMGMYKNSKASMLELLDAQLKYFNARAKFIKNKYDLVINKIKFYKALGNLNIINIINLENI